MHILQSKCFRVISCRGCRVGELRCVALGATKEPAGSSTIQGCGMPKAKGVSFLIMEFSGDMGVDFYMDCLNI